ncbi:MAG TPA: TonB-dependent receptor [Caulobacteraceae bacterium]|jgi:outer membrane receptor protein involved in Fe transport
MLSKITAVALATASALAMAGAAQAQIEPTQVEELVVTATKTPVEAGRFPGTVTVISGEELRARGVTTLRSALALTAGVDAPPGGDAGPAGAVPAFWGLQEFDAFLLVVDGVPYGGAFNPAIPTLDFLNVERIEVLRGAAPVSYGATSFVGVIQVFHYAPGHTRGEAGAFIGDPSKGGAYISTDLPAMGDLAQSIALRAETTSFKQDRSGFDRFHGLYRLGGDTPLGRVRLDLDGVVLRQEPYSPHPREGSGLSTRFPRDANVNPTDARQDQDRIQLNLGLERDLGAARWVTTASAAYTSSRNTRGFLREEFADDGVTVNADGFRQRVRQTDVYLDTYLAFTPTPQLSLTVGADYLYGRGAQRSENFEYAVLPDGSNAPLSTTLPVDESTHVLDRRNFAGLYTNAVWTPNDRLLITGGLRLNFTDEDQFGEVVDEHAPPGTPPESSSDTKSKTRLAGTLGASYAVWRAGPDHVTAFINYRDTYKPAAVDLGPEGEGEILEPESARSWEGGLKGRLAGGRFEWEASLFTMRFENLVIRENVGGLPSLANAGSERFKGGEVEARWHVTPDMSVAANYAHHEATFIDYARLRPDGSIQQLAGNTLELSPENIGGVGLIYEPAEGFQGSAVVRYVGERFLNKGNSVVADAYTTLDISAGYRFADWTVRVVGENLTDRRDPVAESELGDAQFYTLPGRTVWVELHHSL